MKSALFKWIAGLAVAVSQTVSAVPITDTVIVGSQEWAQVDLFTNVSWNTFNTQCPGGVCLAESSTNGYDLAGWTWASIDTVQSLFNSFTEQPTEAPGVFVQLNSSWAPIILSLFKPTYALSPFSDILDGWSSTASNSDYSYIASVTDYKSAAAAVNSDSVLTWHSRNNTRPQLYVGAWFVRDATPAPAPETLALFGLGLASMWIARRKRGAKV